MTQDIKDCPFCGHAARVHKTADGCYIKCHGCGAQTKRYPYSTRNKAEDSAVGAWNRRAGEADEVNLVLT
ncbi:MAG: Lar family restriction alleviation protein [Firmicutes bacterium]|nr:Lar family restriction alleviation protein [Bacillota bacterium]